MSIPKVYAVVRPGTERADLWRAWLGDDHVEVESHVPVVAEIAGSDRLHCCYRMRVSPLSPEQFDGITRGLAELWDHDLVVVRESAGDYGIPVFAHDIFVCTDPEIGREFWRSFVDDAPPREAGGGL